MSQGAAAAIATLAGFAVMCLELTAVRILAPHFGDSAHVWTNVIGVMLVALAGGAWLGGRLAHAEESGRRLSGLFAASGVLVAIVPVLSGPLGGWLLPRDLPLDAAMAALVRGSLVATLVLFAPAITLVGCMTPMLVTSLVGRGVAVGRASGLIAATSTIGSLLGTFAATHLLVPELGSRNTVWLCSGAILLCAVLARPKSLAAAAALLPLGLSLSFSGPMRPAAQGEELLAEQESRYQYLQVVRSRIGDEVCTALKINEGLDSFHSVAIDGSPFTGGRYYDYHAVVPYLASDGEAIGGLQVLSLGAAAGTYSRVFEAAHPGCNVDSVEIDEEVVALGSEYFGGRPAAGAVYSGLDARVFVARAPKPYDVVLVDCYERQIYLPAHVASREFFAEVSDCLREGGVVSVNSGGRSFDDPVVNAVAGTMASVFGEAQAFRVPDSRNFMLVARKGQPIRSELLAAVASEVPAMQPILEETSRPSAWKRYQPGGEVLHDDRPMLDALQEDALTSDLNRAGLLSMDGEMDPDRAAEQATELLTEQRDYEGALAVLQRARGATVRLRLLAGDVRWRLHDLDGALREYGAASEAATEDWLPFARGRVELAESELGRRQRARSVASRNAWLGALAAAGLAGLLAVAVRRAGR